MVPTLLVALGLALLYWFPIRRWYLRWGATPVDLRRAMAGDAIVPYPTYATTLAIKVDAPPEDIWPGSCRWAIGAVASTATTGSTGSSAISIGRVPIASSRRYST